MPIVVGEADAAMALCERALAQGVFAQAIRPPTVPAGTCRLRMTAMATHRVKELRTAARVIAREARELGLADGAPAPAGAAGAEDEGDDGRLGLRRAA